MVIIETENRPGQTIYRLLNSNQNATFSWVSLIGLWTTRPRTKKLFKNSCSRQLRIVNAVARWSSAGQIDWPKSVFVQDKVTFFETTMTTMNEVNRDKTKVPDSFFSVMFRWSVLLLNSMSKLIHNRCTCNSTATYLYANEQLRVCFYVLIRYSLFLSCSALKLY